MSIQKWNDDEWWTPMTCLLLFFEMRWNPQTIGEWPPWLPRSLALSTGHPGECADATLRTGHHHLQRCHQCVWRTKWTRSSTMWVWRCGTPKHGMVNHLLSNRKMTFWGGILPFSDRPIRRLVLTATSPKLLRWQVSSARALLYVYVSWFSLEWSLWIDRSASFTYSPGYGRMNRAFSLPGRSHLFGSAVG